MTSTDKKYSIGQCFLYNGCRDNELVRISGSPDGNFYELEPYSFTEGRWLPADRRRSVSDLKSYYRPLSVDIGRLLENERRVDTGLPLLSYDPASAKLLDTGDSFKDEDGGLPSVQSSEPIRELLDESERVRDYIDTVLYLSKARIQEKLNMLRSDSNPLNIAAKRMEFQVDVLRKTIDVLKMYLGENVRMTTVREGSKAPAGMPVTIRQRILFMDEEMAVLGDDSKGLDAHDIHLFAEWLENPSNRDIIVPEEKCVVVMKPRRYKKRYVGDFSENARLNMWNFHSFVVLRNGENVHILESDDFCMYGAALPRRVDIEAAAKGYTEESRRDKLLDLNYRAMLLGKLIQGIADRTDLLSPGPRIDPETSAGLRFVYDDERDTMVGTGILPFRDFVKEVGKSLRRGSRVIYFGTGNHDRYYVYSFSKPAEPEHGLYSLEDIMPYPTFLYTPKPSWHGEAARRRERWRPDSGSIINYDAVTSAQLEAYLSDRTQRESYESIIPLLANLKKEKQREEKLEAEFKACLLRDPLLKTAPSGNELDEAIAWWKGKVIFTRPLDLDDRKSYRMILGYLNSGKKKDNGNNT